ncbi:hypothetical protein BDV38DRAFT_277726 [Aspergillus pseudotamarii]|uniref:Uncharacterized protein n=1 Tax=Aspergillus pseudotamarii TaxID=132259 RepID=A0A5N6T9C3_ASPPS|nr:uncharacterized protein BDV38DRAFT_277726 [Aspergillus pseudotamarii]KAE8142913.1 hypothetical protein BDV38DRAFT_277726 [Aspergillus pseudotamarii]
MPLKHYELMIQTNDPGPDLGGPPGSDEGTVLEIAQKAGASGGRNLVAPPIHPAMYHIKVDVNSSGGAEEYRGRFRQAWWEGKDSEGNHLPSASVMIGEAD